MVGTWRILQKVGSHRWTTDDIVTAYIAITELRRIQTSIAESITNNTTTTTTSTSTATRLHYLDLGCGNASVLQMVSWGILHLLQQQKPNINKDTHHDKDDNLGKYQHSFKAFGIEARREAVQLATRSLSFNIGAENIGKIISLINGDFRVLGEGKNGAKDDSNNENKGCDTDNSEDVGDGSSTKDSTSEAIHTSGRKEFDRVKKQKFDLITGTPPYFRVDFNTEEQQKNVDNESSCERVVTSAVINQG